MSKAISEARARIRDLKRTIAEGEAAQQAANARQAPIDKRRTAAVARHEKVALLTEAAAQPGRNVYLDLGPIREVSLASIGLGYGKVDSKTLDKDLLSGDIKVDLIHSSVSYTLRGMLRRTVIVDQSQLAEIKVARRKVAKAEAALKAAVAVQKAAFEAAFAVGAKPEPQAIAKELAVRLGLPQSAQPTDDEWKAIHAARDARPEMRDAEFHLFWLTSSEDEWRKKYSETAGIPSERPAECPCATDQAARANAERLAKLNAELDELPTGLFDCPAEKHGRHRAAFRLTSVRYAQWTEELRASIVAKAVETGIAREDAERVLPKVPQYGGAPIDDVPTATCRKDKAHPVAYIRAAEWVRTLLKNEAAWAKAHAKAEKEAAKVRRLPRKAAVDIGDGDTVAFDCPTCGEHIESEVTMDQRFDDGELIVGCEDDDIGFRLANLANVQLVRKAA